MSRQIKVSTTASAEFLRSTSTGAGLSSGSLFGSRAVLDVVSK
jgi:hypothetical protein